MSLTEELNSLKTSLTQTREKFISDWTTDQYDQFKNRQTKLYRANCKLDRDTITQHGENIENLLKQTDVSKKGIEEKTTRLAFLKQELEQMSKDISKTLNCKETVSMEIQQALQYIEQNQQTLKTTTTDLDHKQADLETQASVYRENLDLQMRKISGGKIQFIFSSLDRNNPETTCYLFIKLSEADRKYIVTDVEPPVADLDQLVDKLNNTNDLKSFMVAMRKRFQQILTSKK